MSGAHIVALSGMSLSCLLFCYAYEDDKEQYSTATNIIGAALVVATGWGMGLLAAWLETLT